MKKIFLIFTALIFMACFNNNDKENKNNSTKHENKALKEKIEKITVKEAEIDYAKNLIYITFTAPIINKEEKGSVIKEKLFDFNPSTVKGTSYWADTDKIVFEISEFKHDKLYQGKFLAENFKLDKENSLKKENYDFSFKFESLKIEKISFNYKIENKINSKLSGVIEFNKPFDINNVTKDLSVMLEKKSIRIIDTKKQDNKLYFETELIALEDGKYKISVNIDNKNSGLIKSVNHSEELVLNRNFLVTKAYAEEKNGKFKIIIDLSRDIDPKQDLKSFIYIENTKEYDVKSDKNKIIIHGKFIPGKLYNVKVFSGLKSKDDFSLMLNYDDNIVMPDLNPQLQFENDGIYLGKSKNNKLRFKSMNLKSVYVSIKKVYDENIEEFINRNNISSSKNNSNKVYEREIIKFGTKIYGNKYNISTEKNKWIETDIDLSNILEKYSKSGMYIVEVSYSKSDLLSKINDYPNKKNDETYKEDYFMINYIYSSGSITKPLLISDLGLIVKKTKDYVYVFTSSISTGDELENVKVDIYGDKGKTSNGISNKNGFAKIKWDGNIKYIEAKSNEDKSYIFPKKNLQDYTLLDNEGIIKPDGIDVFAYTERGIYRPGDKIYLTAILREQGKKLPDNIPLKVKLFSPLGKLYTEKLNLEGKDGVYSYLLKTSANSPTGNWKIIFYMGKEKIKESFISIETVVSPKIKADLKGKMENNKNYSLTIKSDYLFGEPAAGLKTKTKFTIKPSSFIFKEYKNYEFKNNLKTFSVINSKFYNNTLNKSGKAYIDYLLPKFTFAPYKLDIQPSVEIFQKDGRKITKKISSTYDFYDEYAGIEKIDQDYLKIGSEVKLKTVLLTKDGKKVEGKKLIYKIYKNDYYWWWDYNTYDDYKRHFKKDQNTILLEEEEINAGDNISYKVNDYGNYYIEVNAQNGHSAGYFVNASYWGENSNSKSASIIEVKSDKNEYKPGDKAQIIFDSPKSGYALVTVEKNNQLLKSFRVKLTSNLTKVPIEINENMVPNVYVNVNMMQDINTLENDRPIRLRGLKSLKVVKPESKIEFDMKVKDTLKSNEKFDIDLQTKDHKKALFTIAVVDEGLLNITNFKTPNPADYFYGKEKNRIITYDMFDQILGVNNAKAEVVLKPGGGMLMESKMGVRANNFRNKQQSGNVNAKRFKALSLYKEPIETDENGHLKVNFTMDDYIGAVRIMVVAIRGDVYNSVEKSVPVKTSIMLDAGMPRSLAPNDLFYSDLNIFFMDEIKGNAEVSLELEGPAKVLGDNKITLKDIKKGERNIKFKIKVANKIGKLKVIYKVRTEKNTVEKTIEIAVNSPAPYTYISKDYKLEKNEVKNIAINAESVLGTSKAKITVSKVPRYNIDHRIKWLIRYPYGCVEQTTSSVFPQLYIDKIMKLNQKDWKETDKNINAAITKLQKFQLENGSLSYWENETYASNWGSIYAFHFLTEAKSKGYYVPKDFYEKLQNYLYETAMKDRKRNLTNIYRIYVLALSGKPNISAMNYFKQSQLTAMDNVEKHLLAGSYKLIKENSTANEILEKSSLNIIKRKDWWISFGSELRDMSMILETYSLLEKSSVSNELFQKIISDLQSDRWYSTQTLSYALMAVSKYAEIKESKTTIKLKYKEYNAKKWKEISTDKAEAVIEVNDLLGKSIEIENTSDNSLYFSYQWEGKEKLNPSKDNSYANKIKLFVRYYTTEGKYINSIKELKQGDTFWAVYEVERDYYNTKNAYMVLMQNLASGLEIENTRLNKSEYPKWLREQYYEIGGKIDYTDIRDDKIMWFFDMDYYRKREVFATKINVVTEGVFYMPGAVTESMYYNYINARTNGTQVIINK